MTLQQHLESALTRARICRQRKRKSSVPFREAIGSAALILARENQKRGCSYKTVELSALRRMAGRG